MPFDPHQEIVDPSTGEYDETVGTQYQEDIEELFADSPEGRALIEHGVTLGWTGTFLGYGMSYLGMTPAEMTESDFNEILFTIFPRKVAVEPNEAAEIVAELRAFWMFLDRAYNLPNAPAVLKQLDDRAVTRLERGLGNSANFGMAKSMIMQGKTRGFDTTSAEGLNAWMQTYNAEQGSGGMPALEAGSALHLSAPSGRKHNDAAKRKSKLKTAKASRKQNRRK